MMIVLLCKSLNRVQRCVISPHTEDPIRYYDQPLSFVDALNDLFFKIFHVQMLINEPFLRTGQPYGVYDAVVVQLVADHYRFRRDERRYNSYHRHVCGTVDHGFFSPVEPCQGLFQFSVWLESSTYEPDCAGSNPKLSRRLFLDLYDVLSQRHSKIRVRVHPYELFVTEAFDQISWTFTVGWFFHIHYYELFSFRPSLISELLQLCIQNLFQSIYCHRSHLPRTHYTMFRS